MGHKLSDVPSSVLNDRLERMPADSEDAIRYRRELARRVGERDEIITLRKAAEILEVPEQTLHRYARLRIIRPADEYGGGPRFWRNEIQRWGSWTRMEGLPNA
jgi:hypothetical protein